MPLPKRYHALGLQNEERVSNGQDPGKANHAKLVQPPTHIRTSAIRNVRRVLVIGDSLLRGTEAPICCPDNISREVYFLPRARIRDVTERLLSLVKPADYHSFLLFQVRSHDVAMRRLRNFKRDFMSLGMSCLSEESMAFTASVMW